MDSETLQRVYLDDGCSPKLENGSPYTGRQMIFKITPIRSATLSVRELHRVITNDVPRGADAYAVRVDSEMSPYGIIHLAGIHYFTQEPKPPKGKGRIDLTSKIA